MTDDDRTAETADHIARSEAVIVPDHELFLVAALVAEDVRRAIKPLIDLDETIAALVEDLDNRIRLIAVREALAGLPEQDLADRLTPRPRLIVQRPRSDQ